MTPIFIATRGSALALAQANAVLAQCRDKFPNLEFDLNVIKTTGDKLQTATPAEAAVAVPKGLFTKELEVALLNKSADLAVHSLKDLPTDLPDGLTLAAVAGKREDVRDVFIFSIDNNVRRKWTLWDLPKGMIVATSSARRKTQILALRPDFTAVEIRGNVPTRLKKLASDKKINATLLAAAGLSRLGIRIDKEGEVQGEGVPKGLFAIMLEPEEMLPCVGQGAIGLEIREGDARMAEICGKLNHPETFQCVTAERAFLRAMGGGCQTPIGACAILKNGELYLRAVAHLTKDAQRAEGTAPPDEAEDLGEQVAARLQSVNRISK